LVFFFDPSVGRRETGAFHLCRNVLIDGMGIVLVSFGPLYRLALFIVHHVLLLYQPFYGAAA
jgi:hypothetical protein